MNRRKGLILLISAIMATGNSCAWAERTAKEAACDFDDPGGRLEILLDPGYTDEPAFLALVEPVIRHATESGATIAVRLVHRGNAASAIPVDLTATADGDLSKDACNSAARAEEARANEAQLMATLHDALAVAPASDETGRDLIGAIRESLRRVDTMPGSGQAEVVLVTGGGVHRTTGLDLIAVHEQSVPPGEAAASVEPFQAPETFITIVGAGDFTGSATTPEVTFSTGITEFWSALCASATRIASCRSLAGYTR